MVSKVSVGIVFWKTEIRIKLPGWLLEAFSPAYRTEFTPPLGGIPALASR
jgi:hypothetical protein